MDHAQRRREITQALWAVIYERGIAGVTLQAVAETGSISVGRIQHYFPSKRELVLAGARDMVQIAIEGWAPTELPDESAALAKLVRQPIPQTEGFRLGAAVWYTYLAASTADPELGAIVREAVHNGFDAATSLTARLSTTDTEAGPRATAVRLVALGNGLGQAVMVGALGAEEALTLIENEFHRTGLLPPERGGARR